MRRRPAGEGEGSEKGRSERQGGEGREGGGDKG